MTCSGTFTLRIPLQKSQQKHCGINITFGSKDKKNMFRVYFAVGLQKAKRNKKNVLHQVHLLYLRVLIIIMS